ncbi:MAG: endonuclease domain-containing protein [Alphaproteobacteria bacterium]|nr:endonuclease domain-containing protein [Alphaproteobacteria bacterium]MBU1525428.1 endonuclease domain-containing protein [Alphaproteobacteria bacterium]MBU2118119.1 endonuclease domain-containing protein [Alphaproteobacteria bacterium]MBU2352569.1 endonuclease domain-containing protein [Alphaproteobacteria bacterium]MBU2381789.1 endonuclease domain-containing protein [Alphaproteobacteria bacterium]
MHQSPDKTRRARRLRREPTLAERRFWEVVRDRRLDGLKFRRETPLAGLTVDFYCAELKLVVELDGGVHRIRELEDAARDGRLRTAGFRVLRCPNEAFLNDPAVLTGEIRRLAGEMRRQPPHPSGSA